MSISPTAAAIHVVSFNSDFTMIVIVERVRKSAGDKRLVCVKGNLRRGWKV